MIGWDVIPGQISAVPTSSIKIRAGKKEFHQMLEILFWKSERLTLPETNSKST